MATFARFREMEKQHGGLIRGVLAGRRSRLKTEDDGPKTDAWSTVHGPRSTVAGSPFVTLRRGMQSLVDALVPRLEGELLSGRAVTGLWHDPTAAQPYRLRLEDGTRIDADVVIVTTPAYAAAELLAPFAEELARGLRAIRYVSSGTITLAYRRAELGRALDGYGVVIPRGEGRRVNAVTLSSAKFRHRAPDDHLLARVFVGGSRTPEALEQGDAELVALAREELRAILGIAVEPMFTRVFRWPAANPQYDLGHRERVAALQALCPAGLYLAGGAYGGVGIPDCVRQGREAAERALALALVTRQEPRVANGEVR
jgi:oxygen-dependent protoporphyrinogen oxidase